MINAVNINIARPIHAFTIACMSRDFVEQGLGWSWTVQRVLAKIHDPNINVVIAQQADCITGFAIMQFYAEQANLALLAVPPQFRRQGIAKQLLLWLEHCCRTAGIFQVYLEVRASNHDAQFFYKSLGYQPRQQLVAYYQGKENALRMHHDLKVHL